MRTLRLAGLVARTWLATRSCCEAPPGGNGDYGWG
jgi:hypothetical protein